MVKKLTVPSKNKPEEKQEMGLKLPEEMRLRQDFLSLPRVRLPILALGFFFVRTSRMVPVPSRGEGKVLRTWLVCPLCVGGMDGQDVGSY